MKCIERDGLVLRVEGSLAEAAVQEHGWRYVARRRWKQSGRRYGRGEDVRA